MAYSRSRVVLINTGLFCKKNAFNFKSCALKRRRR